MSGDERWRPAELGDFPNRKVSEYTHDIAVYSTPSVSLEHLVQICTLSYKDVVERPNIRQ